MDSANKLVYIALAVICLYLLPFFILGENSAILIHDTLDDWVVRVKVLAESGQVFAPLDATVEQIMNGIPRNTLASEFNLFLLLNTFFGTFNAYVILVALMHFVAFAGMYLLLKNHFLRDKKHRLLVVGIALAFALLPFNLNRMLGIAAQPLALYAILNIRAQQSSKKDWLIVLLFPLLSSFTRASFFFLAGIALLWLYDTFKARKVNYRVFIALALMTLISVLVEYRLVFNMFLDSSYVSHRVEFKGYPTDSIRVLGRSARTFIFGIYHAASLHHYFVIIAAGIALAAIHLKKLQLSLLTKLLAIVVAISLFVEFISGWAVLEPLKAQFSLLNTFGFERFNSLFPLLWYLIFALSLAVIFDNLKHGKKIAFALIILQCAFLFSYSDELVQSGGIGLLLNQGMTYNEFFSPALFQEIKDYIAVPQSDYRVVSIGMHPQISLYNGFYALDAYHDNYPLQYKYSFRRIIEKELEKSPAHLKRYFDTWGSRCYVWVADLNGGYFYTKDKGAKVDNLELNTEALKEMGGEYILSAVEITNAAENDLQLLRTFENSESPWKIWLYGVQ